MDKPGMRNNDVVEGGVAFAEAGEADFDDHVRGALRGERREWMEDWTWSWRWEFDRAEGEGVAKAFFSSAATACQLRLFTVFQFVV